MNRSKVESIIKEYLDHFTFLNDVNLEYEKWQYVNRFKYVFDLEADDFVSMLKAARTASGNITENYTQPFSGLITLSEKCGEMETVRNAFRLLYQKDDGDLKIRQEKIDDFIHMSNLLNDRYFPGTFRFKHDQHAVTAYQWLYDPDEYYLYKATQCLSVASKVDFYDSWNEKTQFGLDIFYRFCDQFLEIINVDEQLLGAHTLLRERFQGSPDTRFDPDENHHILLFDLLYADKYGIYDGIASEYVTQKQKAERKEIQGIAEARYADLKEAEENADRLFEIRDYALRAWNEGTIYNKYLGEGALDSINGSTCSVFFKKDNSIRKYHLLKTLATGVIQIQYPDFEKMIGQYRDVINKEVQITERLMNARAAFEPYQHFID